MIKTTICQPKLVINFQDLVAYVLKLLALTPVSGAFSCPVTGTCPYFYSVHVPYDL